MFEKNLNTRKPLINAMVPFEGK